MKQLAIGSLIYSNDNNDHLPSSSRWMDETMAEHIVNRKSVFSCPDVKNGFGYSMNSALGDVSTSGLPNAAYRVLLFESNEITWNAHGGASDMALPARHRGKDNVGFADGHAKAEVPGKINF